MADISTPTGVRDWAYSWLCGDPVAPWASRALALRKIADTINRIHCVYPDAARELRTILLLAEMGYGPIHCMESVRIARETEYEKQWGMVYRIKHFRYERGVSDANADEPPTEASPEYNLGYADGKKQR